jgi:phosphoglycolate phosphatase-like HAD superfamily hydrolase
MLPENYMELDLDGEKAYVRKDRLSQLRRIDGVIFDCDGVLIDIRDSYNRAISKTVVYILEGLTGTAVPERLISDEVIFLFRKSGGFNCDRDTVYGILMFILSGLPGEVRGKLKRLVEEARWQPDPFERFSSMREAAKKGVSPEDLSGEVFEVLFDKLKGFTELLDATGADSVDRNLVEVSGVSETFVDFHCVLKRFLYYPAEVGESIVATVFEEFFCGPKLFQETYGVEAKFYKGFGMVENETVIVQPETLDRLSSFFSKANLGVASGSKFEPARYVLRDLLQKFNPEASIFLDTIEQTEDERSSREGVKVNLKKPHPFSLLRAAEAFGCFDSVVYVGDSMEDAVIVREARKLGKPFSFAGVYRYSGLEEEVLRSFLESGSDIVIPSVNELPLVLEALRRDKK